jgi:glycosyltransferase involved in cell wall biosynthesis
VKVAIDTRRIRDFGVGTYIRNLLQALAVAGSEHRYAIICSPEDRSLFADLPSNFETVPYDRRDSSRTDHFQLPRLIRKLRADVTHIPFHRVPLLLEKPYAVTIHDLSSLFFDDASGLLHAARGFRFRRGLERASGIIAVSGATRLDVMNLVPSASDRIRLIYNAPDPSFLRAADETDMDVRERYRVLER